MRDLSRLLRKGNIFTAFIS